MISICRGFNGAAASQPRNDAQAMNLAGRDNWLQWGRGFTAAEWEHVLEILGSARPPLQWGCGFTAAECMRARRPISAPPVLQWGRGFTAAE